MRPVDVEVVLAVVLVVDVAGCGLCLRGGDQGGRLHQLLAAALDVVLDVLAVRGGRPRPCFPRRLAVVLVVELVATWPRVVAAVALAVEVAAAAVASAVELAAATAEVLAMVLAVVLAMVLVVVLAVVLALALATALAMPLPAALACGAGRDAGPESVLIFLEIRPRWCLPGAGRCAVGRAGRAAALYAWRRP